MACVGWKCIHYFCSGSKKRNSADGACSVDVAAVLTLLHFDTFTVHNMTFLLAFREDIYIISVDVLISFNILFYNK